MVVEFMCFRIAQNLEEVGPYTKLSISSISIVAPLYPLLYCTWTFLCFLFFFFFFNPMSPKTESSLFSRSKSLPSSDELDSLSLLFSVTSSPWLILYYRSYIACSLSIFFACFSLSANSYSSL